LSRIVARNIHRRLIAALCCAAGVIGFRLYQPETPPSSFLVRPVLLDLPIENPSPFQYRDISEYKYGGYVEDCFASDRPKICRSSRERLRKFVLGSWLAKRKSYIEIESGCRDCTSENYLFVEPDENGTWHFVIFQTADRIYAPARQWLAVDVKRRRVDAPYDSAYKGKSVLVFHDEDGNEVEWF
jgi:hypothetical protein